MEARPLEVPTVMNGLGSALDARPTPAPEPGFQDDNDTTDTEEDVEDDMEVRVATLLSGTFAPMPGVTDGPKPWEAAGLLGRYTPWQGTNVKCIIHGIYTVGGLFLCPKKSPAAMGRI